MRKSKNNNTGIVHALSKKKVNILRLYETVCGMSSGLFWTNANDTPVTCKTCLVFTGGRK